MLVTLKEILSDANEKRYAVPAFDVVEQVSAEAVVRAAEAQNRPVIVMVPEAAFPLIDTKIFFAYLIWLAKGATVPVALQLDHGQSIEAVQMSVDAGFTSVMIDGSALALEENIALTKQAVAIAHAKGASVEAEIGHVAGGEGSFDGSEVDETMYTKPSEAEYFAKATGVDALAVAVGTVHGVYKGTPKLDFTRLQTIKELVAMPLVLHGGSGVSDEEFLRAIQGGINKVNLFTEISMAALRKSLDYARERGEKLHFAELLIAGKQEVFNIVVDYLEKFGEKR